MAKLPQELRGLVHDHRGITGLETAIVLIAFVVVSSVFAFATLSTGLISDDKTKETIKAGLDEAQGTMQVRGQVIAGAALATISNGAANVTGEVVGVGTPGKKVFHLDNAPVTASSETIYVDGVAQVRDTDYTINNSSGKITFTVAPPDNASITADYQYDVPALGTGDGVTTDYPLAQQPVIVGSETIFLDNIAQEKSAYTLNYLTGVISFITPPANGVQVGAEYTYYVISNVTVQVANAAGGHAINLSSGDLVATYLDKDTSVTGITQGGGSNNFTLTKLGNADADSVLEAGEMFGVKVDVSAYGLAHEEEFTIQLKPPSGAVVTVTKRIPSGVAKSMILR